MKVNGRKTCLWLGLLATLLLGPCASHLWATTTPEKAYDDAQAILSKDPGLAKTDYLPLYDDLWTMAETRASTDSSAAKILSLQWSLANETSNDEQIRRMALQGFRLAAADSVKAAVSGYLKDSNYWLRIAAAEVSIEYGDTTGIGVLMTDEVYSALVFYGVSGVHDRLVAATGSASPFGRMKAAYELDGIDSTLYYRELVGMSILDMYAARRYSYPDASNLNQAMFWAFLFTQKEPWTNIGGYISSALGDTSLAFRTSAICAISRYSNSGESGALSLLDSLSTGSVYPDIREQALMLINSRTPCNTRYAQERQ